MTEQHQAEMAAAQAALASKAQEDVRKTELELRNKHILELDRVRGQNEIAASEAAGQATQAAYTEAAIRQQAAVDAACAKEKAYMEGRMDATAEKLLEKPSYPEHIVNKKVKEAQARIRMEARLVCDDSKAKVVDVFKGFEVLQGALQMAIEQPLAPSLLEPASRPVATVVPLSQPTSPRAQPAASASQSFFPTSADSYCLVPVLAGAESSAQPDSEAKAPASIQPTAPILHSSIVNLQPAVDDGTASIATTTGVATVPSVSLDLADPELRVSPVSFPGIAAARAAAGADAVATMTALERTLTSTTPLPSATLVPTGTVGELTDDPELAGHESVRGPPSQPNLDS